MTRRWTAAVVAAMALLLVVGTPIPAKAGPAGLCQSASAPGCGGAAEDLACGDSANDPQDCVDTGNGCACRPRVCCNCENVGNSIGCNVAGCTQTGIGLVACVTSCLILNQINDDGCNLKVVNHAVCTGGSCNVTGCCAVTAAATQANYAVRSEASVGQCFETDAATCGLLDQFATFVPGGSCDGGLDGPCVSPTATATATGTVTNTPTGTATHTGTVTHTGTATGSPTHTGTVTSTPTNTLVPNGGECVTPGQCSSMFCVDGVCCNTACDQPLEICNSPDDPGTCTTATAPAPALSPGGLFFAAVALLIVGAVAMLVRVQRR